MATVTVPDIQSFNKGDTVLIEVEFKKQTPFGSLSYFDPTAPTIDITAPNGTTQVTAAVLVKTDVGKWYYLCQTLTSWMGGHYNIKSPSTDGTYNGVEITKPGLEEGFVLE